MSEWSKLKVLYLTDDRESYSRGNYYVAYQRAFVRQTTVTLAHPLEPLPDPAGFDLVVFGHASIEHYGRIRGAQYIPPRLLPHLWWRRSSLRALRRTRTPKIVFTKNDYKKQEIKDGFLQYVRPQIAVIQHRNAIPLYKTPPGGRLQWVPFGVDTEMFSPPADPIPVSARSFVLGFRASTNGKWNGDVRERFYNALHRLEGRMPVALSLDTRGRNFLVGQPYVDWIRSCALLGNSVSALGAVGPKFLEAMACDTPPIAPTHAYEDLLRPHEHYVPVDPGEHGTFPGLEAAVERYVSDPAYQQQLRHHGLELVRAHSVYEHVRGLLRDTVSRR
ncbi:MAG: glycosyltransferase family 1 protein [Deltaproteobacteria bacterium]|nr:glycosyltransferase family 1 protein [Deltaproteobacteria bacterium]